MPTSLILALVGLLATTTVEAQTIYKCQVNGKVTYSGSPCSSGVEVKRMAPDGGPTPEDRARARMRLQAELAQRQVAEEDRAAASAATSPPRAVPLPGPVADSSDNEKVMVQTRSGWEYKTKGQLKAEQAAYEGKPLPRTGAAWESERVTTHGLSGWGSSNRLDAAKETGARRREAEENMKAAAASSSRQGFRQDQYGNTWLQNGGTAINPTTGRNCTVAGSVLVNCF